MKKLLALFAGITLIFALTACGQKTQDDVIRDLDEKLQEMKGYKANAKMTLKMGTEPQVYNVEIWHKDPSFYRVNLRNSKKDQSQMILRNDDGVYVLTPALNKSFRFQSEWPKNSSQAYLYESLVKDIIEDKSATFKETDKHYVFETKTRYQNSKMLPYQTITFNKRDLSPVSVKVMDSDRNALVTVDFSKVKFNTSFDNDAFDMKKNMTGAQLEVPVMGKEDKGFAVKYPSFELDGVKLTDEAKLDTEDGKRVVLTYEGEKSYTLIQEKAEVVQTLLVSKSINGEPVDLGYTVGAMTDNTISWTHNGIDYLLASENLSAAEMVKVARSVDVAATK
ncbi:LolA family protein [Peribacillus sp. SCS-155]|uniref:LolA family protein n=1 Tax=Peribacillus sedimenti TaxID=3115297 RepID=UPI0039065C0B